MKILKWIILSVALFAIIAAWVWATEPPVPDAIKLHHRDGRVTTTPFVTFKHLKFSGSNVILVNTTGSESVSMDELSKITFGQKQEQEPPTPEVINLHHRDGRVFSVAFTAFNHLKFSGNNMVLVSTTGWAESVSMDSLSKITFGQKLQQEPTETVIVVTFAIVGTGSGTLSAYVLENGVQTQTLTSGDEVKAGKMVEFKAAPGTDSKVKGWRINDQFETNADTAKSIMLNENLHANGLYVEVEFEKIEPTSVENLETTQNKLNVYVQNRAINIESSLDIERVDILDISGMVLTSGNYGRQHRVEISVEKLKAGLYLLKIRTADGEEIRKVIIR